jgi:kumamolisin
LPPKQLEETLDAEWTSGIAPDARIRIYATSSLAFIDLDKGLDRIIADAEQDPSLRQLSISLGLGETYLADVNGQPGDVIVSETDRYLTLASLGVNVFVSSGDGGSNPGPTGKGPSQGNPMQVEYPASDPFVIGVGGTSLTLDQRTGIVTGETSWFSGGGGISRFFGRPEWQKGSGLDSGGFRYVPDVSLAADPDTGALVIYQGQQTVVGGTSWSAPVWAGICALINEARNKQQKQALPYLNPNLYRLIGSDRIRDITSGSNMGFNAGPGYDATTGIGVPHLANLVAYFASLP